MYFAKRIRMKQHCSLSQNPAEIDTIYLDNCELPDYYSKESIHDYLVENPGTIVVGIWPYSKVIPVTSSSGEKYVRSQANWTQKDNLLSLPRD